MSSSRRTFVRLELATFSSQPRYPSVSLPPPPNPQPTARAPATSKSSEVLSTVRSGASIPVFFVGSSVPFGRWPPPNLSLPSAASPSVACNVGSHLPPLTLLPRRKQKCMQPLHPTHPTWARVPLNHTSFPTPIQLRELSAGSLATARW